MVHCPFDGPYVFRTTRSLLSRTRNAPTPTVIGRVATLGNMETRRGPNKMAFCPLAVLRTLGPMARKVTFTPKEFLRNIWQLGNFDVSPDGRKLAYTANKGEQWSVYIKNLRTGREKPLLRSDQSVLQPEFSPDGKWLAIASDFEGDENFN